MSTSLVYDLSFTDLKSLLAKWNEPSYRARQIWKGLYCNYWNTAGEFSILPTSLRRKLDENLEFNVLFPITTLQSKDGETVKTLFKLHDGKAIETVLMKYDPRTGLRQFQTKASAIGRRTICISTQVGCAMGCVFCATGQMGFKRNLSSGEIVAQVIYFAGLLHAQGETLTNVVVMGMGEPFHNFKNTMAAIDLLNDFEGYNFGARRFTISTVGLVPAIREFIVENRQINLAISLHAASNNLRTSMLPINRLYPIEDLLEVCREYVTKTGRRISFEWALVNGINDTQEQAHILATKLKGLLCHVNAIPLNPTENFSGKMSSRKKAKLFKDTLLNSGIPCTIRIRRGVDITAGCGQLMIKEDNKEK